jgi:hypothetical protein
MNFKDIFELCYHSIKNNINTTHNSKDINVICCLEILVGCIDECITFNILNLPNYTNCLQNNFISKIVNHFDINLLVKDMLLHIFNLIDNYSMIVTPNMLLLLLKSLKLFDVIEDKNIWVSDEMHTDPVLTLGDYYERWSLNALKLLYPIQNQDNNK